MRTSPEVDQIQAALVAFHTDLPEVSTDSQGNFKNKFASLIANIKAADPKAAAAGICLVQLMGYDVIDGVVIDTLVTRICHSSGQYIEEAQRLHLPKDDPQGQGSAMTYGRRYNYQGAYGLAAEDDDANAATAARARSGVEAPGPPSSAASPAAASRKRPPPGQPTAPEEPRANGHGELLSETRQHNVIRKIANGAGKTSDADVMHMVRTCLTPERQGVESLAELTKVEAVQVITGLSGGTES